MSEVYIRSRDKEGLYTIKESCGIRYKEFTNAGMKENRIMLNMDATSMYTLGIYESKERCIEIIDEIQSVCVAVFICAGQHRLTDRQRGYAAYGSSDTALISDAGKVRGAYGEKTTGNAAHL